MLKRVKEHHDFMMSFSAALFSAFRRPAAVFLIFLSGSLATTSTLAFYFLEVGKNSHMSGLLDSLYFCLSTMTGVGYGDITPVTAAGKILAMALMLLGTALYVCFVATVASTLMEFEIIRARPKHRHKT